MARRRSGPTPRGLPLDQVVHALDEIAPPVLAAEWDNVGLLVEPPQLEVVRRVLLANDLTDAVLDEAERGGVEMVCAYHPPLFRPVRRLVRADADARRVLRAVAAGIAVHSPHTALDAAPGGLDDWLTDALGAGTRRALARPTDPRAAAIGTEAGAVVGQGRRLVLDHPEPVTALLSRWKKRLGLKRLRVAQALRHAAGEPVRTVALCAGAGGAVLRDVDADLVLTGEMGHHDVLAALSRGASVALCEHAATERGYLPVLRQRLALRLQGAVDVRLSAADRGPIEWA